MQSPGEIPHIDDGNECNLNGTKMRRQSSFMQFTFNLITSSVASLHIAQLIGRFYIQDSALGPVMKCVSGLRQLNVQRRNHERRVLWFSHEARDSLGQWEHEGAAFLVRLPRTNQRMINNASPPSRGYRNLMSFNEKVLSRHQKAKNNTRTPINHCALLD